MDFDDNFMNELIPDFSLQARIEVLEKRIENPV